MVPCVISRHTGAVMLNDALKQIREFHQIRQVDMAERLGISKSHLSGIENNNKSVSMGLLHKYAEVFNVPASSLLMFAENFEAAKKSDKLRLKCANKIVKVMEWISARDEPASSKG